MIVKLEKVISFIKKQAQRELDYKKSLKESSPEMSDRCGIEGRALFNLCSQLETIEDFHED